MGSSAGKIDNNTFFFSFLSFLSGCQDDGLQLVVHSRCGNLALFGNLGTKKRKDGGTERVRIPHQVFITGPAADLSLSSPASVSGGHQVNVLRPEAFPPMR